MLEFGNSTYPNARKEYKCDLCGETIHKGEKYHRWCEKYDGDMFDLKYHLTCQKIINAYCNANGDDEYDNDGICDDTQINIMNYVQQLKEQSNNGWIPCIVVEHPEHCNDCEVTFKDVRGYGRDIAFYTDKWIRASDEVPILVVAWKEPSAPYQPKGE